MFLSITRRLRQVNPVILDGGLALGLATVVLVEVASLSDCDWRKSVRGGAICSGPISDDLSKLGEGVCKAGTRRYVGPEVVEAPADVLDKGVAGDDNPGGAISLQSSHRRGVEP
jgi:hypothetical protein